MEDEGKLVQVLQLACPLYYSLANMHIPCGPVKSLQSLRSLQVILQCWRLQTALIINSCFWFLLGGKSFSFIALVATEY